MNDSVFRLERTFLSESTNSFSNCNNTFKLLLHNFYFLAKNNALHSKITKKLMKIYVAEFFIRYPKKCKFVIKEILKFQLKNKKYDIDFHIYTKNLLSYQNIYFLKFVKYACSDLFSILSTQERKIIDDLILDNYDIELKSFDISLINELIIKSKKDIITIKLSKCLYLCINIRNYILNSYLIKDRWIFFNCKRMLSPITISTQKLIIDNLSSIKYTQQYINNFSFKIIKKCICSHDSIDNSFLLNQALSYPLSITKELIRDLNMLCIHNRKYISIILPFFIKNKTEILKITKLYYDKIFIGAIVNDIMINLDDLLQKKFSIISFFKFIFDIIDIKFWNSVIGNKKIYFDKYDYYKTYVNNIYKKSKSIEFRYRLLGWRRAFIVNEED